MTSVADSDSRMDFARAFGDGLRQFLSANGIQQIEAARLLGIRDKHGNPNKARLNTYCHDSPAGKRPVPNAEILYLACTKLPGFHFDFRGQRISASTLNGNRGKRSERTAEQLTLHFDRQFNLTDDAGTVTVRVRRPPGHIELAFSLKAEAC